MLGFLRGFRKFTMAGIFLLVAIILLLAGEVPREDWLKHVSSVIVAFMATNVGEHILEVAKDWVKRAK